MLTHALAAAAISLSASSWYCESGDPGGGGPTADIETMTDGTYKLKVEYNRRNLESAARSSVYDFEGRATSTTNVKQNGVDCIRATFRARGKRSLEFLTCGDSDGAVLRLINFTPVDRSFEISCQ